MSAVLLPLETETDILNQTKSQGRVPYVSEGISSSDEYSSPDDSPTKGGRRISRDDMQIENRKTKQIQLNYRKLSSNTTDNLCREQAFRGGNVASQSVAGTSLSEKKSVQFKLEPIDNVSKPGYERKDDEIQKHQVAKTNWKKGILQRHTNDVMKAETTDHTKEKKSVGLVKPDSDLKSRKTKLCTDSSLLQRNEAVFNTPLISSKQQSLSTSYPLSHMYAMYKPAVDDTAYHREQQRPMNSRQSWQVSYCVPLPPEKPEVQSQSSTPLPVPPPDLAPKIPISGPPPTSIPAPISCAIPNVLKSQVLVSSPSFPIVLAQSARRKVILYRDFKLTLSYGILVYFPCLFCHFSFTCRTQETSKVVSYDNTFWI